MISRTIRTFRLGFKSLLLHKLRSGLAMLGILIGVTAVIWLVALGEGVSYQAQQQIKDLGATNIIIKSQKPPQGSSSGQNRSFIIEYGLRWADYDRIVSIPTVKRAVPMREIRMEIWAGGRKADCRLIGCTPAYREINHLELARGRYLSDRDLEEEENVAVLAAGAAEKLFPFGNPLGKTVQVSPVGSPDLYKVVGLTAVRAPSAAIGGSLEGRDYNMDVYIPLTTLQSRFGKEIITSRSGSREGEKVDLNQITVTVGDISQVEQTAEVIETLLGMYRAEGEYSITVPKELLRQAEMLRMMFNVLLVLIAGISLVVGGIGIMNIMLATVTERTREIGVRRAMGARRRDIIFQFLAETVVLTASGGTLGLLFGFLCKPTVHQLKSLIENHFHDVWTSLPPTVQNLDPIIAPWSIIVAFGISVVVGVAFGMYPARRAALMDPIEALRHE